MKNMNSLFHRRSYKFDLFMKQVELRVKNKKQRRFFNLDLNQQRWWHYGQGIRCWSFPA